MANIEDGGARHSGIAEEGEALKTSEVNTSSPLNNRPA